MISVTTRSACETTCSCLQNMSFDIGGMLQPATTNITNAAWADLIPGSERNSDIELNVLVGEILVDVDITSKPGVDAGFEHELQRDANSNAER